MSLFMQKWPLMQGEGGGDGGAGGGGGGGDDKGDKGDDKSKGADHSETMLRGIAVLAQGFSKMQESQGQLLEILKAQAATKDDKGGEADDKNKSKGNGELFSGVDMEQMDRPQFAALLLSKFEERLSHHLKEAVKPFDERLGKVSDRLEKDLANREVQGASKGRPDFYEWRAEIGELVKQNPGLSVQRAYTLARSENAEKMKKMDEKYAPKKETTGGGFSLSPTGGGGRGEGATKMKFNEAAEKAYSDVLASLGGVSLDQLPVTGKGH